MNKDTTNSKRRFSLRGLSIQQRLPLLICVLLLCIIISFGFASYYGVRNASMDMGRERLGALANQLSAILSQSTSTLIATTKKVADNDTIRQCLLDSNADLKQQTASVLKKLRTDSLATMVELLDADYLSIARYSEAEEALQDALSKTWKPASGKPEFDKVGKIIVIGNAMYFPVVCAVRNKQEIMGYLVNWRLLTNNPKSIEMLSQLMGKGTVFYLGNADRNFWTDMIKPAKDPIRGARETKGYYEYRDLKGKEVIAAVQPVSKSNWLVLIEISKKDVLEGASRFLNRIYIIGGLLIAIGLLIAWVMSRSITRPLKQLTKAATAISKRNYSLPVEVNRRDELGELASAFNIMAEQVHATQLDLEHKVTERTAQLQAVNKELEAFSYSVSHDLRAPLRGIIGFTAILEEEYGSKLDDEAKRITSVIRSNTLKMGNLIDALLTFSRIGRNEITKMDINNNEMVKEAIASLEPKQHVNAIKWIVGPLPNTAGDINTMRQVWINLVSNAIKYSGGKDQPVIEIGSFIHEGQTAFFVKDNGVGFDEKYKDKLFKVFQRLHGGHEFEGTGVGLAIIEKIITKHGGKVWAEGAVGAGASFYFSVPAE